MTDLTPADTKILTSLKKDTFIDPDFVHTPESMMKNHEVSKPKQPPKGEKELITETPATMNIEEPKELQEEPKEEQPSIPGITENKVLTSLKQRFGLVNIKTKTITLNNMSFKIKPIDCDRLTWAEAHALASCVDSVGNYNPIEYKGKLRTFIAAVSVDSIDGVSLDEIFSSSHKTTWLNFAQFLQSESTDYLTKEIYNFYEDEIDSSAKVVAFKSDSTNQSYRCPKCQYITVYPNRSEQYFCHLDGSILQKYHLESDYPLV